MTVCVLHPQRQHSHQVARALAEAGLLERYMTSCHFGPGQFTFIPASLRAKLSKRSFPDIPPDRIITFPYVELTLKAIERFLPPSSRERLFYHNVWLFDRIVARRVALSPARVVVGYENSCHATFQAAKKMGKYCVLDAASIHYGMQREFYAPPFSTDFLEQINARKEAEIQAADHILTLSNYARDTYLRAGVPVEKVSVIPLGVDCSRFQCCGSKGAGKGFRFLYVGNVKLFKGIDLLLAAFEKLVIPDKQLVIIGATGDASSLLQPLPEGVTVKGHMPHEQLSAEYNQADVFVLPSRVDGFGLVVTEAMATGVPVIVSSHVGAKDLVRHGENGWIFESGDADSLYISLMRSYELKQSLPMMGKCARMTVENYTWERYRSTVAAFYAEILRGLE